MPRTSTKKKSKSESTGSTDKRQHPEWSALNPREVESRIVELAKSGKSTSEIGMILRISMRSLTQGLQQAKKFQK